MTTLAVFDHFLMAKNDRYRPVRLFVHVARENTQKSPFFGAFWPQKGEFSQQIREKLRNRYFAKKIAIFSKIRFANFSKKLKMAFRLFFGYVS